jgi:catechol 2,3-dioxygenase-like lactoylglutathione lyase family enzyme
MDMKIELIVLPVSDVDRAKAFYEQLGFRLDLDKSVGEQWRAVHFTPPGSWSSIMFGRGMTSAAPGSAQGLYLGHPGGPRRACRSRRRGERCVP